ncbi:DUF7563 family protein [Natrinema thermotolerans]|uniref:DUF7563 family protein n=1 Tax=Natrinema thermotolerans TaxID=121872 RepID=UPI00268F230C
MAECDNFGAHVTEQYKRVFSANDGTLHACSNCREQTEMFNGAGSKPDRSIELGDR